MGPRVVSGLLGAFDSDPAEQLGKRTALRAREADFKRPGGATWPTDCHACPRSRLQALVVELKSFGTPDQTRRPVAHRAGTEPIFPSLSLLMVLSSSICLLIIRVLLNFVLVHMLEFLSLGSKGSVGKGRRLRAYACKPVFLISSN